MASPWLIALVTTLLVALAGIYVSYQRDTPASYLRKTTAELRTDYDYVIAGGGTAGCVLAARLSEDSDSTVLLLEAGGSELEDSLTRWLTRLPTLTPSLMLLPHLSWQYRTVPQAQAAYGFTNKQIAWPAGRMLGGSSATNYMLYTRGLSTTYDAWAAGGATGWSYADVKPFFEKVEQVIELTPTSATYFQTLTDAFLAAGKFLQRSYSNGRASIGDFYQLSSAMVDGKRWHAGIGYLFPALNRPNLHVMTHAHVTKIEVIADLPVGQNLQDHLFVPVRVTLNTSVSFTEAKVTTVSELLKYALLGTGMLTESVGMPAAGSVKLGDESTAELFLYLLNIGSTSRLYQLISGLSEEAWRRFAPGIYDPSAEGCFIAPTLVYAHARGNITLASRDPFQFPSINPQYLNNDHDVEVLIQGIRLAIKMAMTQPFQALGATYHIPDFHLCAHHPADTDALYGCIVKHIAMTMYHYAGTCKMGRSSDPATVVDPQLRVKGISGLRVVDASVMPAISGGNTMAPTLMLAEKTAVDIRQQHRSR
ncbi:PREDICTED: glucose dehydrogenase [FAD, quinone]-like isoform X2 [Priapulus caudatus]|uniref:Glucose dehydrogenase [FAD, quinone]-like isoform X2 n=1 Tax=Priapulus caudatus TaxID=37621 RepID=A0ABM1ESX1_PRICU|nr:PREDICTED: glucose dehydrogenase [FAD, quinone]-like isoform X2 [Priapulus caudatus]